MPRVHIDRVRGMNTLCLSLQHTGKPYIQVDTIVLLTPTYPCSGPSGDASRLQTGPLADGTAHLPIFCPIYRRARRQTGWPIWEHFVHYADWTKCRQIGQNVGRWDVPSADIPSADWAKCSQMGPSADGTAHLPKFCLVCRRARRQKGWHVGRLGKKLADGTSHLLTSGLQIGQNVARLDRPICRRPVCRLDKMADWAKCWQMGRPICWRPVCRLGKM